MVEKEISHQNKKSDNDPLISIIVPVYNVETYLPECLNSLVNQTYSNIEIICVNDGSTDNSLEVLQKYAQKDNRIIIIEQKNQGLSAARNTGLSHVHGKYLMFVDSDDWVEKNTCECAIEAVYKYNSELVLWSYTSEFNAQSKNKLMPWDDNIFFDNKQVKEKLHKRLCGLNGEELKTPEYANIIETAWGKLYLSKIVLENRIQFIDTKIIGTEDALFNLYVFGHVKSAVYLRKCLNHYRKTNETSLTSKYRPDLYKQWQTLFGMMAKYIKENQLSQKYMDALYNRIALSILGLGLNIMDSDYGTVKKIKMIHEIIASDRYQKAYRKLNYRYFPIHWKIFYKCAKFKCASGVYILLRVINLMR